VKHPVQVAILDRDWEDLEDYVFPGEKEHRTQSHLTFFIFTHVLNRFPLLRTAASNLGGKRREERKTQAKQAKELAAAILRFLEDNPGEWGTLMLDAIDSGDWGMVDKLLIGMDTIRATMAQL